MAAHVGIFVLSYLLGYVALWLWWVCRTFAQALPDRAQVGRLVMLLGSSTLLGIILAEVVGVILMPPDCAGCMGCWNPPHSAIMGWRLWRRVEAL